MKNLSHLRDIVDIEKIFNKDGSYIIKTTYVPYEIVFDIKSNTYVKKEIKLR